MGNREDLLAGAKQAILERGLAKVTARDIAGAAGVSLAAIGYHFGSKERLIAEAIAEATGDEIGQGMEAAIRDAGEGRSLPESVAATWNGMLDVIQNHPDELILSFENGVRVARSPESQQYFSEATEEVYTALLEPLRAVHPELSAADARAVAKVYFALFQGMALQWLIAPAAEPVTGDDVMRAVRAMAGK
ncbi:TetR/AcrR family transcriptional regulator [Nocardia veterana]|uniref:TetR/AcrR family transcriptional regulator n=1 Tax=Nocardia veterana TaxID=132249 RepID=A0A7X6LV53_9NOCA|nr:TetR/AcrR family transcriptional regulator [Nocardia veterana]NKY85179.1 TetR/AcrR family transcriptional regulator [Nocardia veterana]